MASETKIARVEATFCVSVVVKRAEKKCTVVKNTLKRVPTCNTWEDLFIDAIINILEDDLSDDIVNKYSKIASISVSREPKGEAFYPENTEEISNTLDFDSNLKYVTVSLQLHSNSPTSHPEIKDANKVLMASRYALKNPQKIGENKKKS